MTFNIHQTVVNEDGEPIREKVSQYRKQLLQLFEQSTEGQALRDEGVQPDNWTSILLDFGIDYLGLTPPQMSVSDFYEILFDLFPRKLSTVPEAAPEIIHALQLFWTFMRREFHLENAEACLKILDDNAARKLKDGLSNPANFDPAKAFVMMGLERGFNMFTEEGIDEWMRVYNAELLAGTGQRVPFRGFSPLPHLSSSRSSSPGKIVDKTKSKVAKGSRKKNRRRR